MITVHLTRHGKSPPLSFLDSNEFSKGSKKPFLEKGKRIPLEVWNPFDPHPTYSPDFCRGEINEPAPKPQTVLLVLDMDIGQWTQTSQ